MKVLLRPDDIGIGEEHPYEKFEARISNSETSLRPALAGLRRGKAK